MSGAARDGSPSALRTNVSKPQTIMCNKTMCNKTHLCRIAAILFGGFLFASSSTAQDEPIRSFEIQDGQVFIDGKVIPPTELPPSLDTGGVQVQYTFSGNVRPVVDVNGNFFVIEAGGLRVAEVFERGRAAISLGKGRPPGAEAANGFSFVIGDEHADFSSFAAPHAAGVGRQARELAAQALRLQELQSRLEHEFDQEEMEELTQAAERLSLQAEEAARAAEALPRLGVQNYLAGVQKHDGELFELLVKEREIEGRTIRLSREILEMAYGRDREARIEELWRELDEAFELKQANRRREISQLEDRLDDLQVMLEERERRRAEIIDSRLRHLLRVDDEFNW